MDYNQFLEKKMGVGSEVYQSVKSGRKAIGIELKESYFNQANITTRTGTTRIKFFVNPCNKQE